MKRIILMAAMLVTATAAYPQETSFINQSDMKWEGAPPSLPKGGKLAVLFGDPSKDGPFSIRAKIGMSDTVD